MSCLHIQIPHHKQLSSTSCNPSTGDSFVPIQFTQLSDIPNGVEGNVRHSSLQAQVQPFQTYTPQQIQEQLQHLHIQQQNDTDTVQVTTLHKQSHITSACREEQREPPQIQESGSSMLHHLLSQSPRSSLSNTNSAVVHHHAHPDNIPLLISQQQQRQTSTMKPSDLSAMLGNVASHASRDLPSFPVNIETQQGSPTKPVGRRSPVQDYQMASIAEDTREEVVGGIPERVVVATHPGITMQYGLPNGLEQQNEKTYPCIATGMTRSSYSTQMLSCDNHTQISQCGDPLNTIRLPTSMSPPQSILNHISNILNGNQIQHYPTIGGIVVEHDGVKLLIASNTPHLNTIHMQYIAGDPTQYQTLSSHLATQLQFTQ